MSSRQPRLFRSLSLGDSVDELMFTRIRTIEPPESFFERKPPATVNVDVSKAGVVAENNKQQQQLQEQKTVYLESPERENKNGEWSKRNQSKEIGSEELGF